VKLLNAAHSPLDSDESRFGFLHALSPYVREQLTVTNKQWARMGMTDRVNDAQRIHDIKAMSAARSSTARVAAVDSSTEVDIASLPQTAKQRVPIDGHTLQSLKDLSALAFKPDSLVNVAAAKGGCIHCAHVYSKPLTVTYRLVHPPAPGSKSGKCRVGEELSWWWVWKL
jgi:hypothetical protein